MDKNFVHIDDIFKNGLSNGEDQERSGAWLRMHELLDKELPQGSTIAARKPYRRYFTALLILLTLGGGAYMLNNHYQIIPTHGDNNQIGKTSISPLLHNVVDKYNNTTHANLLNQNPGHIVKKENTTQRKTSASNHTTKHSVITSPLNNKNNLQPILASANNTVPKSVLTQITSLPNTSHTAHKVSDEQVTKEIAKNIQTPPQSNLPKALSNNQKIENKISGKTPKFSKKAIATTSKQLIAAANNHTIYQDNSGNILKLKTDTINQVTVIERTVKSNQIDKTGINKPIQKIITDTISKERVARQRLVQLSPLETYALQNLTITPEINAVALNHSLLYTSGERTVHLVTLSDYKVKSKLVTPIKMKKILTNSSQRYHDFLSGYGRFYIGLLTGVNYAFGNPQAFGGQVGIGGYYSLTPRLTLGMELMYQNRFYNNYKIYDPYTSYTVLSKNQYGSYWEFNYEQNSHNDYYQIKNSASIEIPFYLNYSLGRWSVLGGLKAAYGFAPHPIIKSEQTTTQGSTTSITEAFPLQQERAQVKKSYFDSRVGLGYVLGLAYDLNRSFSIDARISQNVWDNAPSDAKAQTISNAIFRMPVFQVGLNFYLGKREKVIYLLDMRK